MEIVTWIYLVGIAVIAFAVTYFQYFFKQNISNKLTYWLASLRGITIFLILLLIINPKLFNTSTVTVKSALFVGVDNSASIKYGNNEQVITDLINALKNDSALDQKFDIQYFGFGAELYNTDTFNFEENQTNLSRPLEAFDKLNPKAPVVLLTDGNQTIGKQVEFSATTNTIYPVIVGDTAIVEDIFINKLNVNEFSFLNNRLPVELFVNYQGEQSLRKKLTVQSEGQIIYEEILSFSEDDSVREVTCYIEASDPGVHYYTAHIAQLESEQNTANNSQSFSIEVIDEQSKLLVLYSVLHPDVGMFKKAIETNRQRSVEIVQIDDFDGDIGSYDLVICYQPTTSFSAVFEELSSRKLNFMCISGLSTNWNYLNTTQPFVRKNATTQSEAYLPLFNADYMSFLVEDIGFSEFAPLQDLFGRLEFLQPHEVLLYKKIGMIETEEPLIASFEQDQQRAMMVFGENMWQWRMNSYQQYGTFNQFDDLINRLIQYLVTSKRADRLKVDVEPIRFAQQPIEFRASYLDNNYNFDSRAKLKLAIYDTNGNELLAVPFSSGPFSFNAEILTLLPGDYTYVVRVEGQEISKSGKIKVLPFNIEQQFSNSKMASLSRLADRTSGKLFFPDQMESLIALLKNDNSFRPELKTTTEEKSLIEWQWLLGLIVILLSLEWFIRKYHGKI